MADYDLTRGGWWDDARTFAEGVAHVSNFPLAYALGVFSALSGHLMGRKIMLRYGMPLYANHYVCLVGESGSHHKSTIMHLGLESLGNWIDEITPIRSVVTAQGLLQQMQGDGSAIVVLEELSMMLQQKKKDYASDLLSRLLELYTCPARADHMVKAEPLTVTGAFLTIISASTMEYLRKGLTVQDLMAGFGNRMTFIVGDPRTEQAWPGKPVFEDLAWHRLVKAEGEILLDSDARTLWEQYYNDLTRSQTGYTPFLRSMCQRLPEKVLKMAMVRATWAGTSTIDAEILAGAIDWAQYLHEGIESLTPAFEDAEQLVLQAIRDGYTTKPRLFGKLASMFAATRIREAVLNLNWLGLAKEVSGRYELTTKRK
ncbi:hypothetical protein LCGC14_0457890 [marine sediment metagenome]|uniref:DUF3987 domain-containing protein n=1 Tax=marine sediment metagenome TaxID=412755 RepID=A0A0F9V2L9_9ZZZZ